MSQLYFRKSAVPGRRQFALYFTVNLFANAGSLRVAKLNKSPVRAEEYPSLTTGQTLPSAAALRRVVVKVHADYASWNKHLMSSVKRRNLRISSIAVGRL